MAAAGTAYRLTNEDLRNRDLVAIYPHRHEGAGEGVDPQEVQTVGDADVDVDDATMAECGRRHGRAMSPKRASGRI